MVNRLRSLRRWTLLLVLVTAGCTGTSRLGETASEMPVEEGLASYYSDRFSGRSTASGEPYDPDARTAAHRRLPFGTKVRVTRIDHEDRPSVVVRINDRGPFVDGRIVDLSRAAAREIEMIRAGVVEVRLTVVSLPGS